MIKTSSRSVLGKIIFFAFIAATYEVVINRIRNKL